MADFFIVGLQSKEGGLQEFIDPDSTIFAEAISICILRVKGGIG
jgi:hypothetical protein